MEWRFEVQTSIEDKKISTKSIAWNFTGLVKIYSCFTVSQCIKVCVIL